MSLDMINCSSRTFYAGLYIKRRSQDLRTITSHEHPRGTFLQAPTQRILKILMQGPLEEDFNRISTRSSHKDLYKIMQGLDAIPQDRHRRTCTGAGEDTTRSWYNNLPRASQKSFHTSLPRVKRKCDRTTLFIAIKELHFSRVFWGVVSAASLNLGMRHTLQKH